MRFTSDRHALHAAFQHVGSVITSTIARPIYQNVKLEVAADAIYLSATDLEVGLKIRTDAVEVQEEGTVLLPQARVSSILGATPDETVCVSGDQNAVVIESSDSKFRIVAEDPSDFRDVPEPSEDGVVEVDPDILTYMVRRTSFAAAEDRGRYALNGLLFLVDEQGNFELVGADGARLANVRKKVSNPAKLTMDCIVMKKGMEQCARLGSLSDNPLRLQVTENQLLAANDKGCVCSQLVEGQFPNYHEVIPKDSKIKVELLTKPFLSALQRAAFLTTEQSRAVDFRFAQGLLVLTSQSPDVGESEVRLPLDYDGEEVAITFNPEYLQEMLRTVERESVKMEFTDPRAPCVLRSGLDYVYVVSPVVQEEASP